MLLTRYGFREWMTITVIAAALVGLFAWLGWWWGAGIVAVVWLALVSFFRDPPRRIAEDLAPGTMLSPADGTISAIETVDHHQATDGPAIIIRIFLSIFNVHVNRVPCDGEVVKVIHRPGEYRDARTPESARVNESNLVIMRLPTGETIGVRQVSGAVARRIVCELSEGQRVQRGERFGMIKFGSTTELILPRPDDVTAQVQQGDSVKGGSAVLARLPLQQTTETDEGNERTSQSVASSGSHHP